MRILASPLCFENLMKKNIASLKERLTGWRDWDITSYELGVCLGFWPDFGAPPGEDCWNGVKGIMWSDNPLGNALSNFIDELVIVGMLERRRGPDVSYRWNPNYKELE